MKPLLIALALSACGPRPDFITTHGAAFHTNGIDWTATDVSQVETEVMDRLQARGWDRTHMENALTRVDASLVPTSFPCDGSPRCLGDEQSGLLEGNIRLAAGICPHRSAYAHELLHWFQKYIRGEIDVNHTSADWVVVNAFIFEGCNT